MFNRTECSNGRANELWDQLERRHQRNPTSDVAERFVGVLATSPLYLFVRERSAALPGAYIYEYPGWAGIANNGFEEAPLHSQVLLKGLDGC